MSTQPGASRHLAVVALMLFVAVSDALAFGVADLNVPPGYTIEVYADAVPNARQIAASPDGTVFVGTRELGLVYALVDSNRDFIVDEVVVIARDLNMPSGVAFRDGHLYVGEIDRIIRFEDIEKRLRKPPAATVVYDALPQDRHHGWKFIAFGPDGKLYVPVGAPCNVCEVDPPYGSILRLQVDSGEVTTYASGIRNSVGFDWDPNTGDLWFADNGRDNLGDDRPPGELNRAPRPGMHFGFPYIHGGDIADPVFGKGHDPAKYQPPALRLNAHVAPLGIVFYRGQMFPKQSYRELFVAEHGSWNRSRKAGYRVMRAQIDDTGEVVAYEPFVTGWLRGQAHWGRPVDFEVLSDGSMLISDDHSGRVYRVSYAP